MTFRSGLAWLSSSSARISSARSVLEALRKPGVIDELGFLMLNAAFAERLYPGVTTLMTRARYIIFVPAIYRYMERSGKAIGKDADRIARDLQFDLRNALARNETSFIGKEGGRNLLRTPSTVYWSALGALGIAVRRVSESRYHRQLSEGLYDARRYKDDDAVVHEEDAESIWDPSLKLGHVLEGGKFPESTSFRLRKAEASFLESRYAGLSSDGHENLVTRMVTLGRRHGVSSLADLAYPWSIPGCEPAVTTVLEHARRLSLLAKGATLQYYSMLLQKKGVSDGDVEDAFVRWWEQANEDLASWDLLGFFNLMTSWGAGRGQKDREFITSWIEQSKAAGTARKAFSGPAARAIIGWRENQVRPGKQRLRVKGQLDKWQLPDGYSTGVYQMNYRHRVGRQIAMDIAEGLERGSG